jgi:5-methylcytosine-specific restriction endonuclease McrA
MPRKDPEARKAYQREYAKRNRELAYARVKEWRANNPEATAEQAKRYAEKHPEKIRAKALNWKYNNLEKARTYNRNAAAKIRLVKADLIKKRKAQYSLENRPVINAAVARRKAAKLTRTPLWLTVDDYWMIEQAYELAQIRTKMFGFDWHVDHIIPLQGKTVSGLHVPWNLQVIPGVENMRKGNRCNYA